jgi:hypothetical protein
MNQQPLPVTQPAGPAGVQQLGAAVQPPQQPAQQPAPQPAQQLGPPLQAGPFGQLPQQPIDYRTNYLDPATDRFSGNFTNLYHKYQPGNSTPQQLRDALYRDGNTGRLLHLLLHVRSQTAAADDPDVIVAYHRLSRRQA